MEETGSALEMVENGKKKGLIEGHYPWDLQEYNKVARFFSSLKESRIESTRCNNCRNIQWPPSSICSKCLSDDLSWIELPKIGNIVAFSKAYVGMNSDEQPPIIVAALDLDNGLRLLTRIVGAKYEDLRLGMPVKLARAAIVDGKPYWAFEPDRTK